MKIIFSLFILFSILNIYKNEQLTSQNSLTSSSGLFAQGEDAAKQWCWTRPEEKRQIEQEFGGQAWGWCKPEKAEETVEYTVVMDSSDSDGRSNTNAFQIRLTGSKGKSEYVEVSNHGFEKGARTTHKIKAKNVGDLMSVNLKGSGKLPYSCKTITIEQEYKFWTFDCDEEIQCPKFCDREYPIRGTQRYEIQVQTSSEANSGDDNAVYIQIMGEELKTNGFVLSEKGFGLGTTVDITKQAIDVGQIKSIRLYAKSVQLWKPEKIIITRAGQNEQVFLGRGETIKCPAKNFMTLYPLLPPGAPEEPEKVDENGQSGGAPPEGDLTDDQIATLKNGYAGESLNPKEKNKMLTLDCESKVFKREEFGELFATNMTNYITVIAKCPGGCWKKDAPGKIYGVGIHPQESSICKAAIVDRAIPLTGGIIQINIHTGLNKYDEGKNPEDFFEIKPLAFGASLKSFTVQKVDNIDICESDIRIVDSNGEMAPEGRVEFRNNGLWGSACASGMNSYAARVICKMLKYTDGRLINTESNVKVCKAHRGSDFCGPEPQPIYFKNIECTENDVHIMGCAREMNKDCTHDMDAIISCSMENFDDSAAPEEGTVRLANFDEEKKAGRLEFFGEGKWGTVCNKNFGTKEANVACQQMGFANGDVPDGKSVPGGVNVCASYNGEDLCGADSMPIARKIQKCTGSESTIKECECIKQTDDCGHNFDAIVECGGSGDPTGASQKEGGAAAGTTPLGKLGFAPIADIDCATGADGQQFLGDPGSVFLVKCGIGCGEQAGVLVGVGIYRSDSSICQAAIHSGVIVSEYGGYVAVTKAMGLPSYIGFNQRGLTSFDASEGQSSFHVSTPPSNYFLMLKLFGGENKFVNLDSEVVAKELASHGENNFMQLQAQTKHHSKNNTLPMIDQPQPSFIQIRSNLALGWKAAFPIFLSQPGYIFKMQPDKPDEDLKVKTAAIVKNRQKLKGDPKKLAFLMQNNFVIAVDFVLRKFDLKDQTILGINCWALKVNQREVLFWEKRETEHYFDTEYVVPMNERIFMMLMAKKIGTNYKFQLWINGKKQVEFDKGVDMSCSGPDFYVDVGVASKTFTESFVGDIDNIKIFNTDLSPAQLTELYQIQKNSEDMFDPNAKDQEGFSPPMTLDRRYCVDACSSDPHPGLEGAEEMPADLAGISDQAEDHTKEGPSMNGNQEEIEKLSTAKNDGMFSWDIEAEFPGAFPQEQADHRDVLGETEEFAELGGQVGGEVACAQTGVNFQGITGKKFKFECPGKCNEEPGNVIGTGQYHDESVICKAAVHDGIITDEAGGEFIVVITNGMESYEGTLQNGVQSLSFHAAPRSISFKQSPKNVVKVECNDTGALKQIQTATLFSIVNIECPKDCSKASGVVVFGGDQDYSEDSSLCLAAIHAGKLTDAGGDCEVLVGGEVNGLPAINANGVQSQEKANFIRSFQILGKKAQTTEFFGPDFDAELYTHWKKEDTDKPDGPKESNWLYTENPTNPSEIVVHQASLIGIKQEFMFGTHLVNMQFDDAQMEFSSRVLFDEMIGKAALIFLRKSADTYFAVEFNGAGKSDIRLIQVVAGKGKVLTYTDPNLISIKAKTWATCKIFYNDKNYIEVHYRPDDNSSMKKIIEHYVHEPVRGQVALGSSQGDKIYFDMMTTSAYVSVEEEEEDLQDRIPIADKCMTGVSEKDIEKKCQAHFTGFDSYNKGFYVDSCKQKYTFCQLCCEEQLEAGEKLWIYGCLQKCVRAVNEVRKNEQSASRAAPTEGPVVAKL